MTKLRKKSIKKFSCFMLSAAMAFSMVACGKRDVVVDDYGDKPGTTAESAETGTATDGESTELNIPVGDGVSLRQLFGEQISWKDSMEVSGVTLDVNTSYSVPDLAGMNVYAARKLEDGKGQEEQIVKALFGDSAEKLEEIKISNETDYMTMAYKYKSIEFQVGMYAEDFDFSSENYESQYELINPEDEETFKWVDNKNYYIHMYEGDYEGTRFCLLLAYDYISGERIIFFDPVSIDEYFPDKDYKTLYVEGTNDSVSQPLEIENECKKSIDEVQDEASKFLEEKILLPSHLNYITTKPTYYKYTGTNSLADLEYSEYAYKDPGVNILSFTHSDFLTTLASKGHGGKGAGYQVLADQENRFAEAEGYDSIYMYLLDLQYSDDETITETEFDVNGYAVYLNDAIFAGETGEHVSGGFKPIIANTGRIKVTDKGIMGVDLILRDEILDVTENVRLLDFDKIMEAFKDQIDDYAIPEEVTEGTSRLVIEEMDLTLLAYMEDDDSLEFSFIPVWEFVIMGNSAGTAVYVNAMDGTMLYINEPEEE